MNQPIAGEVELFLAALDLSEASHREAYLQAACGSDEVLKARILSLLAAHARMRGPLDQSPVVSPLPPTVDFPFSARTGTVIAGKYKLLEPVGEGGMGTVWMAEQREPVKRLVAVKLIKVGMDSKSVLARFEAERQALAMMDHPNIARILDGGITEAGAPFFVMELVKGVPITAFCDARKLTPQQRLALFIPVCQAIQHAHQKGIIHRDIKPSNVMIALYDDRPVPKVIDFGVAKATGQALTEQTLNTGFSVVGTPQYMSPEQATFNQLDIDTRSDIYALGILLYELLAGSPPFHKQELEKAGYLEILRMIREKEPQRPSTKLSTADGLPSLSANRSMAPKKLTGLLRNELDWIVMKALEKDRARRYQTANGFAADIGRYLSGEPIQAHPPSAAYRLRKLVLKNQGLVMAATVVSLALVAGLMGTSWGMIRAETSRIEAEAARDAERVRAKGEQEAKQNALLQKARAEKAEAETLADYRAATDDAIEQLIGSKSELSSQERAYLEKTLSRWQNFARRQGEDQHQRAIRAEGYYRVGFIWIQLGQFEQASAAFEQAEAIYRDLSQDFPDITLYRKRLAGRHGNRGFVLGEFGNIAAAQSLLQNAIQVLERLTQDYSDTENTEDHEQLANIHNNLASLLEKHGNRTEATVHLLRSIQILEQQIQKYPSNVAARKFLAGCQNNMGRSLMVAGKLAEAEDYYLRALEIKKKLVAESPTSPTLRRALGLGHHNLATVLGHLHRADDSQQQYGEALVIRKQLVDDFPAVSIYGRELASTLNRLGAILANQHKPVLAEQHHQRALDVMAKVAAVSIHLPDYREELSEINFSMGCLLDESNRQQDAQKYYRTSIDILEKLAAEFPAIPSYRVSLGASLCNNGRCVRMSGHPQDSLVWFDRAIQTLQVVYAKDEAQLDARAFLRNSYHSRATAFDQLLSYSQAIKDWDLVIELSLPQQKHSARVSRVISLHLDGQVSKAIDEIAELTNPTPTESRHEVPRGADYYNFACIYALSSTKAPGQQVEYRNRAIAMLRQSIQSGFSDKSQISQDPDLDPLRERDDFKQILAEVDKQ